MRNIRRHLPTRSSFLVLPSDVLSNIIFLLEQKDQLTLRLVCSSFNSAVCASWLSVSEKPEEIDYHLGLRAVVRPDSGILSSPVRSYVTRLELSGWPDDPEVFKMAVAVFQRVGLSNMGLPDDHSPQQASFSSPARPGSSRARPSTASIFLRPSSASPLVRPNSAARPSTAARPGTASSSQTPRTILSSETPRFAPVLTPMVRSLTVHGYGPSIGRALSTSVEVLVNLRHLNISGNEIHYSGCSSLAASLPFLFNLESIDLSNNGLGDLGVTALAGALPSLGMLKEICLSSNSITELGIGALCSALARLPYLEDLDLGKNDLGDDGAATLASQFEDIAGVTRLVLCGNGIGDKGASLLATHLRELDQLQRIDLSRNAIRVTGAQAVFGALLQLPQLTSFDLDGNHPSVDLSSLQLSFEIMKAHI